MRSRIWNNPKPWLRWDRRAGERARFHAVVYDDDFATVAAAGRMHALGYRVADVLSPFPLHGIDEAIGLRPTRLSAATLAGGIAGAVLGLGFQAWVSVVDWPMNIGGKSDLALPALMPITFEVAVLLAAIATVAALVVSNRLRPSGRALDGPLEGVSDDRFVIVVHETDGRFDVARFRALAHETGAARVIEGWRAT